MKKHKCPLCPREYQSERDRDRHLWKIHKVRRADILGERKKHMPCDVKGCKQRFQSERDLNKHKFYIHGIDENGKSRWRRGE